VQAATEAPDGRPLNVPAGQAVQVARDAAAKVPTGHAEHADASGGETEPTSHDAHTLLPVDAAKEPASQPTQSATVVLAVPECALPRGHKAQTVEAAVAAYVPGVHAAHARALAPLKLPSAQGVHVEDPGVAKWPAVHAMQAVADALDVRALAVPAGQASQAVCPVLDEKEPTAHGTHAAAVAAANVVLAVPAAQSMHTDWSLWAKRPATHEAQLVEPARETLPSAQGMHVRALDAPTAVLNVPAAQSAQRVCAASAKEPPRHTVHCAAGAAEMAPAVHREHDVAPAVVLVNEPASQVEQIDAPDEAAKEPSGHDSHTPALVAPCTELEVPGAHGVHVLLSGETKRPAVHCWHTVDATTEAEPVAHGTHSTPACAKVPTAHCEHALEATDDTQPWKHVVHEVAPEATPVKVPGWQAVQTVVAAEAEKDPEAHERHAAEDVASGVSLNFPAAHSTHADCSADAYEPVGQSLHTLAPASAYQPARHDSQLLRELPAGAAL
jgi:hypothetical protein